MTLNVQNLDKLIAHLEAQPPERFHMRYVFRGTDGSCAFDVPSLSDCGTAACIAGHCAYAMGARIGEEFYSTKARDWLGLSREGQAQLFMPDYYDRDAERYPLYRAIATLKRLRDRFLATGEIVVDWGPEPGSEPVSEPWSAPQAIELTPPALPDEITRLLGAGKVEA